MRATRTKFVATSAGCEEVVGIRFAMDSLLEGEGFDRSVPLRISRLFRRSGRAGELKRGSLGRVVSPVGD